MLRQRSNSTSRSLWHFSNFLKIFRLNLGIIKGPFFREKNSTLEKVPNIDEVLQLLKNSSFKGAAVYQELKISSFNYKKENEEKFYFHTLEQKMISYNIAVHLPYESMYLCPTFMRKIRQLIEGGFFDHWISNYLKHKSIIEKDLEDDKVVLTMNDHLYPGFAIWLTMLLIASMAFVAELVRFYVSNLRTRLFKTILETFYKFKVNH